MKYPVFIFLLFLTLFSCHRVRDAEDPYLLAAAYCNCINDRVQYAKDSSVDVNECNVIYYTSRFMQIHLSKDKQPLGKGTLDSASRFFTTVEETTDTLCMIKVDRKKLKPRAKL